MVYGASLLSDWFPCIFGGTVFLPARSSRMVYFLPFATAAMFGYIMWLVVFRLRLERVKTQRVSTRGRFAFRPKERARFLLGRAFSVSTDKAEWEEPLLSGLVNVPVSPEENRAAARGR